MRRTTIILLVMMGFFVSLTAINRTNAQEAELILESTDVFVKKQRPAVVFNHEKHMDVYSDCMECHHIYEYNNGDKENVWEGDEQSCSECHKLKIEDKKMPLMKAFHENCTGCHRKLVKENEKAGPVTCGECHIRKK
ncbi:cytochrome c3 family protein [Thermodesulfobacteriota bacterium]